MRLVFALAALFVLCIGCSEPSTGGAAESRVELSGWSYRSGDSPRAATGKFSWLAEGDAADWRPIASDARLYWNSKESKRVWMKARIPATAVRDPALMLDPLLTQYECYIDGKLVDRHGDLEEPRAIWHGLTWRLVPLPEDQREHELMLRVRSTHWLIGVQGGAFVGSVAAHRQAILHADIGRFIAAGIALLVGIAGLVLAAFSVGARRLQFLAGAYAIGAASYTLYYTKLRTLLFDHPLFWEDVYRIGTHVCVISMVAFVCELFGPGWRGLLRKLWRLHAVVFVAFTAFVYLLGYRSAVALQWVTFQGVMEVVLRLFIGVEVIALLVLVVKRARERDTDARIFCAGILAPTFFTMHDVLASFGIVHFAWDSFTFVGTLTVIAAVITIVQRRREAMLMELSATVAANSRERSELLRDLHDGIGGITTNIRFLAESAAISESQEQRRRAISDIAELSKEGLAEMRSLLNSLDERDLSWPQLVKQLRHIGNQLLQPHGIDLTLESDVHPASPALTSRVCANVLRTYQEAINNVFKHANAKRVNVSVTVRSTAFELSVADDGVGVGGEDAPSGVGGFGIRNMQGRARDLGGALSLTRGNPNGTTVRLEFPLAPPDAGLPRPAVAE